VHLTLVCLTAPHACVEGSTITGRHVGSRRTQSVAGQCLMWQVSSRRLRTGSGVMAFVFALAFAFAFCVLRFAFCVSSRCGFTRPLNECPDQVLIPLFDDMLELHSACPPTHALTLIHSLTQPPTKPNRTQPPTHLLAHSLTRESTQLQQTAFIHSSAHFYTYSFTRTPTPSHNVRVNKQKNKKNKKQVMVAVEHLRHGPRQASSLLVDSRSARPCHHRLYSGGLAASAGSLQHVEQVLHGAASFCVLNVQPCN